MNHEIVTLFSRFCPIANVSGTMRTCPDPFSVTLLLSEPFDLRADEVLEAVGENFPSLGLVGESEENATHRVGVDRFEMMLASGDARVVVASAPGQPHLDPPPRLKHSFSCKATWHGLSSIAAAITIKTTDNGPDLDARLASARRVTAVSSILAAHADCVGVFIPSARMIVAPERWQSAAEEAVAGYVPIDAWIAFSVNRRQHGTTGAQLLSCRSEGLRVFTGEEMLVPWARLAPGDATTTVFQALWLRLVNRSVFQDRDTMGPETDPSEVQIRWDGDGKMGLDGPGWALFRRECVLPEGEERARIAVMPDLGTVPAPARAAPFRFVH